MYNRFDARKATPEELDNYRKSFAGWSDDPRVKCQRLTDRNNPASTAVVFSKVTNGTTQIVAFEGKKINPTINTWTHDAGYATKIVNNFFAAVTRAEEFKAKRKEITRNVDMTGYTVGAYIHVQFMYESTRNEFYQILAVKGQIVTVRRVSSHVYEYTAGYYCGTELPTCNAFVKDEPEIKCRVTFNGVKVKGSAGHLYDGRPVRFSDMS